MLSYLVSRFGNVFTRLTLAVMILAGLVFSLAQPVSAAGPSFTIASVKSDQTVTVRTKEFPANVNFTIRMDAAGNMAVDGIVVGQLNSGIGGAFEATVKIPAELRGTQTIAIRFESKEGYFTYNWFNNRTSQPDNNPVPVTSGGPRLTILGVKANDSVTVEAQNLPAYTTLSVRVGPYYTFSRDYVYTPSVRTDANGYVKFTISLPDVAKNVSLVTVRVDGGGRYAYNAFKNVDGGTTIPVTSTGACQIVSVTPGSSVTTRADFDAVWTVKNVSNKTWDGNSVDYKFVSGSKTYKWNSVYDLHQTIKPGETVKVVVDMIAPSQAGYYTTNWALVQGGVTLCNLPLSLRVK